MANHTRLWTQTSKAISAFYDDLKEHNATDNVVLFVFSEFGRRVHDNGSGADHGAGGIAFVIGDAVKGGLYGEYPSLQAGKLLEETSTLTMTSVAPTRRYWSAGWAWMPGPLWVAVSSRLTSYKK